MTLGLIISMIGGALVGYNLTKGNFWFILGIALIVFGSLIP